MKLTELELLAALENLRIRHSESDYILRVASGIVAKCFGYDDRIEWTEKVADAGLVEYRDSSKAEKHYKELMDKLDNSGH